MITELKINDIVKIENRLYKVSIGKWCNTSEWMNKNGKGQGLKINLKVLREKELNDLIMKGGLE
jgi:hypothetical protein